MADQTQLSLLLEGAEAWNHAQAANRFAADLREVDLSGKDLSRTNLAGAILAGANLSRTDFSMANLTGADLQDVNLSDACLTGTKLRDSNLQRADLRGVQNRFGSDGSDQVAGADLAGAKLPDQFNQLGGHLENAKSISESARKQFLGLVGACLYCWLTIATTTDLNLITNRASSPLPIIQTSIPIVGFYMVAPLILLCVYLYFHFYLQKLWEELSFLPAVFPDGQPLYAKVDPWLLNDFVRSRLPRLSANRPFLCYLQMWISVLLAWWLVPATMVLFWLRYLRRHEQIGTAVHIAIVVTSIAGATYLYRLANSTLLGVKTAPFFWRKVLMWRHGRKGYGMVAALCVLFGLTSLGAIWGARAHEYDAYRVRVRSFLPMAMEKMGYSPFANLNDAEVSLKKPGWTGKAEVAIDYAISRSNSEFVAGAELYGADLAFASAERAFFAYANMSTARLAGANLQHADLRGADLTKADLTDAQMAYANLRGANLTFARMSNSHLPGADLYGANLRCAEGLDDIRWAENWRAAFYDKEMLEALGLPSDHNETLAKEMKVAHSEIIIGGCR
jgi:uncharacterized protein YjbI with pentapeptide repeats